MEDERKDAAELASEVAGPTAATEAAEESPGELRQQRDDYYDRLLRKTAEFDNYRKRIDRERQQVADAAAADLLTELLPLVDDLERALQADAGGDATDAIRVNARFPARSAKYARRVQGAAARALDLTNREPER